LSPRDKDSAVIDPTHIFLKLPHPVVLGNNCRIKIPERLHMYNYDVDLLKMSRVMLETCRGF
jgi:hypothetical protein